MVVVVVVVGVVDVVEGVEVVVVAVEVDPSIGFGQFRKSRTAAQPLHVIAAAWTYAYKHSMNVSKGWQPHLRERVRVQWYLTPVSVKCVALSKVSPAAYQAIRPIFVTGPQPADVHVSVTF